MDNQIMRPMDWWVETSRKWIIKSHGNANLPVFGTRHFSELLEYEIYQNQHDFQHLALKWDVSLSVLGELIADHCRRLEGGEIE